MAPLRVEELSSAATIRRSMTLDFETEYGVNAAYVQGLYEEWKQDANRVDESWRKLFETAEGRAEPAAPSAASDGQIAERAVAPAMPAPAPRRAPAAAPAPAPAPAPSTSGKSAD